MTPIPDSLRPLLERVCRADASKGASAIDLAEGWKAMEELRAILAQEQAKEEPVRGCIKPGCFPYCDCDSVDAAPQPQPSAAQDAAGEREAFEAWYRKEFSIPDWATAPLCRTDAGAYDMPLAHNSWAAWQARAAWQRTQSAPAGERETIRAVFLRNGFTVKEGQTDLKPYVYAAAEELLSIARASWLRTQAAGVPDDAMVAVASAAYEREALAGATHEQAWHVALSEAIAAAPAQPAPRNEQAGEVQRLREALERAETYVQTAFSRAQSKDPLGRKLPPDHPISVDLALVQAALSQQADGGVKS